MERSYICKNCNTTFIRNTLAYRGKFCSMSCCYAFKIKLNNNSYKICKVCKENKLGSEFERNKHGNIRKECKDCRQKYTRNLTKKYKELYGVVYTVYRRGQSVAAFSKELLVRAKDRAKAKKLEIDIDVPFIEDLYNQQKGLCALSGKSLTYIVGKKKVHTNISIDRINSAKGYTKDNVQLVCYMANSMKNSLSPEELVDWCLCIIKTYEDKNAT